MASIHHVSSPPPRADSYIFKQAQAKQLTNLIRRLEAATSRLEDIANSAAEDPRSVATTAAAGSVNGDVTPSAPPAPAPPAKIDIPEPLEELPETVQGFDAMMNEELKPFAELSEKLGGLIAEQVSLTASFRWETADDD